MTPRRTTTIFATALLVAAVSGCGQSGLGPAEATPKADQAHIEAQMQRSKDMMKNRPKTPGRFPGRPPGR